MIHICNLQRLQDDTALNNTPLWFGEWAISTGFNATDEFLYKWADAQKFAYGKDKGWIVCRVCSFISRKIDTHVLSSSGTSRSRRRVPMLANGALRDHGGTNELMTRPSTGRTLKV